jgi:hypothetical protein
VLEARQSQVVTHAGGVLLTDFRAKSATVLHPFSAGRPKVRRHVRGRSGPKLLALAKSEFCFAHHAALRELLHFVHDAGVRSCHGGELSWFRL